jgi:hypothetical protein
MFSPSVSGGSDQSGQATGGAVKLRSAATSGRRRSARRTHRPIGKSSGSGSAGTSDSRARTALCSSTRRPAAELPADESLVAAFVSHPAHEALAAAAKLRPSVDISVA